jgi:DMSO/TMAO reductase YedYZ heme-binding membrane subunit
MEITFYDIVIYLGILGLLMMIFSFLTGMRYIKIKPKYKVHKRVGVVGFIFAMIHGFTMLYNYFFS